MQIELKRIQREVGITFIYVTHDQEEALTMSDRIAVMNEGRVEQIGSPHRDLSHARRRSSWPTSSGWPTCCPASWAGRTAPTRRHGGGQPAHPRALGRSGISSPAIAGDGHGPARAAPAGQPDAPGRDGHSGDGARTPSSRARSIRCSLNALDGTEIVAHVGPEDTVTGLEPGQTLWASWDPDAARLLPPAGYRGERRTRPSDHRGAGNRRSPPHSLNQEHRDERPTVRRKGS